MPARKSSIYELLCLSNLAIPDYQRPYKWTKRNIEELLSDIFKAIKETRKYGDSYKYRIGTILLHSAKDGKQYIVDGQQRIISVALVCLYLQPTFHSDLTEHLFSDDVSKHNIKENYEVDVSLVDDETIHQVNRDYRNVDRVTDVISFAFNDDKDPKDQINSLDVQKMLGE